LEDECELIKAAKDEMRVRREHDDILVDKGTQGLAHILHGVLQAG
jgi:hypothetical protein